MSYSVGQVAAIAGVTVRTLHHYDRIGLLSPRGRTTAGYRRYGHDDLARLQRILFYRELELSLDHIGQLLDEAVDPVDHLRRQRELLLGRVERLRRLVTTLETTMQAHEMGISLTPEEMLEVFGDHDPTTHADEVERRWGDTDTYRESTRRTRQYDKQDWERIKQEAEQIEDGLASALRDGADAGSERAMDLVEAHRQHISRWFSDCSHHMQLGLGEMYLADERFAAHYDQRADGLARFVHDAIVANAARAGAGVDGEG